MHIVIGLRCISTDYIILPKPLGVIKSQDLTYFRTYSVPLSVWFPGVISSLRFIMLKWSFEVSHPFVTVTSPSSFCGCWYFHHNPPPAVKAIGTGWLQVQVSVKRVPFMCCFKLLLSQQKGYLSFERCTGFYVLYICWFILCKSISFVIQNEPVVKIIEIIHISHIHHIVFI